MRKILSIIGCTLLAVILAAVAVVFVFEKDIPTEWVGKQIEEVKTYEFGEINNADELPDGTIRYAKERLSYSKENGKTITTIEEKTEYTFTKSGSGDEIKIKIVIVNYTNNGQTKTTTRVSVYKEGESYYAKTNDEEPMELSDLSGPLMTYGMMIMDVFEGSPEVVLKASIVSMIENNLTKVSQKGLNIKLHLEKDNVMAELGYNVVAKKVSSYKEITKTYTDETLTAKQTSYLIIK